MSIRDYQPVFRCSICKAVVDPNRDDKCRNGHPLDWNLTSAVPAKPLVAGAAAPNKPIESSEATLSKPVLYIYLIIVVVLGAALGASLYLGTNYTTFASSIVSALTTIAGFAVGINATQSGKSTK